MGTQNLGSAITGREAWDRLYEQDDRDLQNDKDAMALHILLLRDQALHPDDDPDQSITNARLAEIRATL